MITRLLISLALAALGLSTLVARGETEPPSSGPPSSFSRCSDALTKPHYDVLPLTARRRYHSGRASFPRRAEPLPIGTASLGARYPEALRELEAVRSEMPRTINYVREFRLRNRRAPTVKEVADYVNIARHAM